jgi:hypothetical protein
MCHDVPAVSQVLVDARAGCAVGHGLGEAFLLAVVLAGCGGSAIDRPPDGPEPFDACVPSCAVRACGADGCGGTCGTCAGGDTCNESGQCGSICTPNCSGRACGSDGCSASCGTCVGGDTCNETGQCASICTPSCSGKACGSDGCSGSCGTCPTGTCGATGQCEATPGLRGWQLTSTNVGLAPHGLSCESLPAYTGSLKPASGARIGGARITGPLDLSNGDIIVEKSCIRPTSVGSHNGFLVTTTICTGNGCSATPVGKVIVRDSEIDASDLSASTIAASCAFLGVGTVQRNYMHGMGSGICFFETGTEFDALAEQNYVTDLRAAGDSHNEAATIRDFRKNSANTRTVKFINNRLDCSSGNETGGLFIQPTWLPIYNVTIEGNYLEGGGYNLYLEATGNATYGNVHSSNNRFRPTGWGPSVVSSGPGWTTWSNNHLYDAMKPDGKGATVNP